MSEWEPKIVAFLCNWCGYAGADMAGVSRLQFAPNAREVRVTCSSRIHPKLIMDAFLEGSDGVLVCGCHLGDCHYLRANELTEETIRVTRIAMGEIVVVVGPNGSGKSTLIDLLSGYLKPETGTIRLNGALLQFIKRTELASLLTVVPQRFAFNFI